MTNAFRLLLCIIAAGVVPGTAAQDKRELGAQNEAKIDHSMSLETPTMGADACQANIVIEYLQFDTRAQVDSIIQNLDCGASSGEYTVRLRIRDGNDAIKTLERIETWARDGNEPVEAQNSYDIGSDVYLIKVSTAKLSCTCAEEQ